MKVQSPDTTETEEAIVAVAAARRPNEYERTIILAPVGWCEQKEDINVSCESLFSQI